MFQRQEYSLTKQISDFKKLKELNQRLQGVKIIRIVPPTTAIDEEKAAYAVNIHHLARFFSKIYSQEINRKDQRKHFYKLFCDRAKSLSQPNAENTQLLLVAVQSNNNQILGVVHFKNDDKNEVVLSSFAADSYNSARGIGRQLIEAMLELWPSTKAIHGMVRRENKKTIEIYRHWGAKESSYGDPVIKKNANAIGMTVSAETLQLFKANHIQKCNEVTTTTCPRSKL